MMWGPTATTLLANEAMLYSQLTVETWGEDGTVTTYAYDDNGSVTNKLVLSLGGATNELHQFGYDLENRLASTVITKDDAGDEIVTTANYVYNQDGIRVRTESATTINGGLIEASTNVFLIDSFNHTGFAQVLEELPAVGAVPTKTYTIGDDVISQSVNHQPLLPLR